VDIEDAEHEAELTFRAAFSERAIALRTMTPRLRLITGLAVAQAIVAAVLLALRGAKLPMTVASNISTAHEGVISVPTPVLWCSAAFLTIAWGYVVSGGLDAALPILLATLALFSGSVALLWLNAGFGGIGAPVEVALLAAIWVAALGLRTKSRRVARRAPGDPADAGARLPGAPRLLVVTGLVAGIYLCFWFAPSREGPASQLFASALFEQLTLMALVLIPALLLAGSEFGEWGEVVGERASAIASGRGKGKVVTVLAIGVAAAVLVHDAVTTGRPLLLELACAAGVALVVGATAWRLRSSTKRWPAALPYLCLVVAAVGLYVASTGDVLIRNSSVILAGARQAEQGGALTGYGQAQSPAFSIKYPSAWTVERVPPDYTIFNGGPWASEFVVLRSHVPADRFQSVVGVTPAEAVPATIRDLLVNQLHEHLVDYYGQPSLAGAWREQLFVLTKSSLQHPYLIGFGAERVVAGRVWVLFGDVRAGLVTGAEARRQAATFQRMVQSWSPSPTRWAGFGGPSFSSSLPLYALGAWILACLAILGLLWARGRRMRPGLAVGLLLVTVAGLLFVASGGEPIRGPGFPYLHLEGIQSAVAVATIGVCAWLVVRRRLDERATKLVSIFLVADIGFQVLVWMYELYGGALSIGGQFSLAQALIVLAALVWELAFSGVTMTNADSRRFPRHARVLVFCGYIMLVATTVLFFSSLHVQSSGTRLEPVFESELWAQRGIVVLAAPMLVTLLVVRVLRWRSAAAPSPQEVPAELGAQRGTPLPGLEPVGSPSSNVTDPAAIV
jgi:hypothetical protein